MVGVFRRPFRPLGPTQRGLGTLTVSTTISVSGSLAAAAPSLAFSGGPRVDLSDNISAPAPTFAFGGGPRVDISGALTVNVALAATVLTAAELTGALAAATATISGAADPIQEISDGISPGLSVVAAIVVTSTIEATGTLQAAQPVLSSDLIGGRPPSRTEVVVEWAKRGRALRIYARRR